MADGQRTFQFRGSEARRTYRYLRKSCLPLPAPGELSGLKKLDKWAGQGWWQRKQHPCICQDGASGRCPQSKVFIQGFTQGSGFNFRIFAPDLLVLVHVTVMRPSRRGRNRKIRIKTLGLEWRIGNVPGSLTGTGNKRARRVS